jgi:hypothetical protein
MWDIIGILAGIFGSIYPVFQVIHIVKQPNYAQGISRKFIFCWCLDKIFGGLVVWHLGSIPMVFKYLFGLSCIAAIAYYKFCRKPNPVDKNQDFM